MPSPTRSTSKSKRSVRAPAKRLQSRPTIRKNAARTVPESSSITNYTTALRWLYEHVDHERMRLVRYDERTFSLDRMRRLLNQLDAPHTQLKAIQVVGSKGKGSVCAMLASMLQACGYTVGVYTSPHLVDLRERIKIDGSMISYQDMAELFKKIASKEHALPKPPSFFEIMTAAAMRYFVDQAVDIAILETGLGGRLDCTTVVRPLVIGMTHISLDHTNILGDDLNTIAREKAGVFKKDVPAVSVEQEPGVSGVLQEVAQDNGTPLDFTGQQIDFSYRFEATRELGPHTRVCVTTGDSHFEHLPVPLRGEHQAHNCGLALALVDKLKSQGFTLPEKQIIVGLSRTTLQGRMEQIWSEPRILIDGAHNAISIQALIRALGAHIAYDSLVMIFGCGQDKDYVGMLNQVALGADKVIFTRAKSNPRAMETEDLLNRFADLSGKMAQSAPNLSGALKLAARAVSREDLIVVTGSFYLVGEARKYFIDAAAKQKKKSALVGSR